MMLRIVEIERVYIVYKQFIISFKINLVSLSLCMVVSNSFR